MVTAQKLLLLIESFTKRVGFKAWLNPKTKHAEIHPLQDDKGMPIEHIDFLHKIGYHSHGGDPYEKREKALDDGWIRLGYYEKDNKGNMEFEIEYRGGPVGDPDVSFLLKRFAEQHNIDPDATVLWEDGHGNYEYYNGVHMIGRKKSRLSAFR